MKCSAGAPSGSPTASPFVRREWIEIISSGNPETERGSPFVRREWIEMISSGVLSLAAKASPFVRREWIEISFHTTSIAYLTVSLREKGVD